jgi:hypothetical protein
LDFNWLFFDCLDNFFRAWIRWFRVFFLNNFFNFFFV